LHEQVDRAITVDVEELGTGVLEAAEEWESKGAAGGVENGERRNTAVENRGGKGGNGR
jgi:hypothetical protein